jgi:hypothetical protein
MDRTYDASNSTGAFIGGRPANGKSACGFAQLIGMGPVLGIIDHDQIASGLG